MRTETVRAEVQGLIKRAPFQPFAMNMENGDRIIIEHPENIAFEPGDDETAGSRDFYVISGNVRLYAAFDAVTSVAIVDQHEHVA